MQSLKLPEELKSVLFSIREEVKILGEKVTAQENWISKEQHELILEEQREPTPEDPLDPLTNSTECISPWLGLPCLPPEELLTRTSSDPPTAIEYIVIECTFLVYIEVYKKS